MKNPITHATMTPTEYISQIGRYHAFFPVAGPGFSSLADHSCDRASTGAIFTDSMGLDREGFAIFMDGAQFGDILRHLHEFHSAFVTIIRRPIAGRVARALELCGRVGEVLSCTPDEDPDRLYSRLNVSAIGDEVLDPVPPC